MSPVGFSSAREHREPFSTTAGVDYWQLLGLAPGADAASLKRAFRAQARRWHPDLNANDPAAEERFKLVNEAYAVLSDPRRRRAWEAGESGEPDGDGRVDLDPFARGFPDFERYLETVLGLGDASPPATDEAWREGDFTADQEEAGDSFADHPIDEPSPPSDTWSGGGDVATAAPSPPPVLAAEDEESTVSLTPEQALHGGRVELELRDGTVVEVWTPALAGDGWRLRLAGVAPGGADHFVQLRVRTPEGLRIDGLRVHYQLNLHPSDAALGCAVIVPTLEGPVRLRVPPRSSSGRQLRLRNRGLRLGDQIGEQYVEVRIVVPDPISEAEEALFRRLRELDEQRHQGDAVSTTLERDPEAG